MPRKSLIKFLERLQNNIEGYINRIENYEDKFADNNWDIVEQLNRLRETLEDAIGVIEELTGILEEE